MHGEFDLTPLDPERDRAWRERVVDRVMSAVREASPTQRATRPSPRAAARPAARALRATSIDDLLSLTRPALAAALLAAAVALVVTRRGTGSVQARPRAAAAGERFAVAEAVGLPAPVASWVESGRTPSTGEVLSAVGGY